MDNDKEKGLNTPQKPRECPTEGKEAHNAELYWRLMRSHKTMAQIRTDGKEHLL